MLIERQGEPITSGEAFTYLVTKKSLKISRASVIFKLQEWGKDGLLDASNGTGKGGVHGIWTLNKTAEEVQHHIARKLLKAMNGALPNVIITILKKSPQ